MIIDITKPNKTCQLKTFCVIKALQLYIFDSVSILYELGDLTLMTIARYESATYRWLCNSIYGGAEL